MSFTFITRKYSYLKFGREPGINSTCLLERRVLTLPLALSSAGPEVLCLRRGLRRPLELEQVAPRMSFGGNVRQQWEKRGKLRVPAGPTGGRVPKYKEGRGWRGIRLCGTQGVPSAWGEIPLACSGSPVLCDWSPSSGLGIHSGAIETF